MIKPLDYIIVSILLLFSFFIIFGTKHKYKDSLREIHLVVNKKTITIKEKPGILDLNNKIIDVHGNIYDFNKNMKFEFSNNKIRVLYSDCHNQICVNTSWIEKCGETLICAPNKVALTIYCPKK